MAEFPIIDADKCNGCGLCVDVCGCHALIMSGNIVTLDDAIQECAWCLDCELVCPMLAISCPFEIVFEESQQS